MVKVKAFNAIRPKEELARYVAELPYDVVTYEEALEKGKNKYSFIHVDRAEIDLDKNIDVYSDKVYRKAKENLNKMMDLGVLIKDEKPCVYIYSQTMNGKTQRGIVLCFSIDDYLNNNIKKHEYTTKKKELDRINHVNICDANTGPIFLAYKENRYLKDIVNLCIQKNGIYDFISDDGVRHECFKIHDENIIENIINIFSRIDDIYIADGHHRAASAVEVGLKRRQENKHFNGSEEFNYFLGVAFPANELNILDYNRVVKDLNNYNKDELIRKISEKFYIEKLKDNVKCKPKEKGEFGMYLEGAWYKLKVKEEVTKDLDVVNSLDVSILQNNILKPILGIDNPRENEKIEFIGGIRGLSELENMVNNNFKVAFSMYPTSIGEIIEIADNNFIMPPKSTWFEPKLRSGLFIHSLK
ncbi:MAG: DUF1015 family protein [Clostridium perfringens]|nr:DUF1015 family protein [Clostridium perfringens]